jgi:UV DNA damage endonuclease
VEFFQGLGDMDIDIMLEVKDKNLSAVKCINCGTAGTIKKLEAEWAKYKYKVLENEPADYLAIRELLKDKEKCPAIAFYQLIEHALATEVTVGNAANTALHLWGYFKELASNTEKNRFFSKLERYQQGTSSLHVLKACLWKMAVQYQQDYLLASYYFVLE